MRTDQHGPADELREIGMRYRLKPQGFEALHLDPVVHDIAERINFLPAGKRLFGLGDRFHHTEAKPDLSSISIFISLIWENMQHDLPT